MLFLKTCSLIIELKFTHFYIKCFPFRNTLQKILVISILYLIIIQNFSYK